MDFITGTEVKRVTTGIGSNAVAYLAAERLAGVLASGDSKLTILDGGPDGLGGTNQVGTIVSTVDLSGMPIHLAAYHGAAEWGFVVGYFGSSTLSKVTYDAGTDSWGAVDLAIGGLTGEITFLVPASAGDAVYLGTTTKKVGAVSLSSGSFSLLLTVDGLPANASLATAAGSLFVVAPDQRTLYEIDTGNGGLLHTEKLSYAATACAASENGQQIFLASPSLRAWLRVANGTFTLSEFMVTFAHPVPGSPVSVSLR